MSGAIPESQWLGNLPPTYLIVRHITDFLQWRFSLLPTGAYRYSRPEGSVDNHSEIHISADFPLRGDVISQRPAITVFRSGAQFQGLGIGDLGHHDLATGEKMRTDLIPMNLLVGIVSRVPVEAETLAWHVYNELSAFRDEIVKGMPGLVSFGQRASISPPGPPGAMVMGTPDIDWTAVIISFPTFLSYKHITTPLNRPILKSMGIGLSVAPTSPPTAPVIPLQGTSIMQPAPMIPQIGNPGLPQPPSSGAESTPPLSVEIEIR